MPVRVPMSERKDVVPEKVLATAKLVDELRADIVCGSQGFAGPSCCILKPRHKGQHVYGRAPRRTTLEHLAADCIEELEARVDALMLEYCPDEMTDEQKARWAAHQSAAPFSSEQVAREG